jgi:hypothetical protein
MLEEYTNQRAVVIKANPIKKIDEKVSITGRFICKSSYPK